MLEHKSRRCVANNNTNYLYNASDTMSYSGVPNILIPLAISIFIVLNTMISSVYERKREIGVYTSVGLAPSHVSFLFIAEAMALAVLSVVLGYLLAQTAAKLFAETSLWAGITVNYSSMAGVAAMILVIIVVLISVLCFHILFSRACRLGFSTLVFFSLCLFYTCIVWFYVALSHPLSFPFACRTLASCGFTWHFVFLPA